MDISRRDRRRLAALDAIDRIATHIYIAIGKRNNAATRWAWHKVTTTTDIYRYDISCGYPEDIASTII